MTTPLAGDALWFWKRRTLQRLTKPGLAIGYEMLGRSAAVRRPDPQLAPGRRVYTWKLAASCICRSKTVDHPEQIPKVFISYSWDDEQHKSWVRKLATRLRDLTLRIYQSGAQFAQDQGLLLADTKLEFGFVGDELVLADEVLTPDSSRYWPAVAYFPGGPQLSFDKQYVRDYLETLDWNKQPPGPVLPEEVVRKTSEKYQEAYYLLSGKELT